MLEELLPYYERELAALRGLAAEFAERYPKVARRLQIDPDHCEDPHVERLLEAFAFLAARIHRRLDDDFPEIAEAFLQVLHPHFLRPMPAATILQLRPGEGLSGRARVPRHTPLLSPRIHGRSCQFRTCNEVDLWPLAVASARLELAQASGHKAELILELATRGGPPLAALGLDRLRFFLDGDPALMHLLYELLCFRLREVRASGGGSGSGRDAVLPASRLRPCGFGPDEAMTELDPRSFPGFRLLAEHFAFPEKFMFVELEGLDAPELAACGDRLQLRFLLSSWGPGERYLRLLQTLSAGNFKLGCVAAVNLFRHSAAPVRIDHGRVSYPVTADNRDGGTFEVHSVDAVTRVVAGSAQEIPPFYSIRHGDQGRPSPFYWYATREPSRRPHDPGTEVELTLCDLDFRPVRPETELLSVQLTCSDRDLPELIPFHGGEFQVPGQPAVASARALRKPSPALRAPAKRGLQWRLVSHLALDHLAMAALGPQALRETLEVYNFTGSKAVARMIQGIAGLTARPATTRLPGRAFAAFVRGAEVTLTLDESGYVGSNLFLFATVLERFLALACPPNSFVQMRLCTLQQEGEVARWPPRSGETPLI